MHASIPPLTLAQMHASMPPLTLAQMHASMPPWTLAQMHASMPPLTLAQMHASMPPWTLAGACESTTATSTCIIMISVQSHGVSAGVQATLAQLAPAAREMR